MNKWTITYNPKPIPDRRHDYDVCHDDYDIDSPDLFFTAESKEEAQNEIDLRDEEMNKEASLYDDPGNYDSSKYEAIVKDYTNNTPCEIEYRDKETKKVVGYWAYGWFDPNMPHKG